MGEEMFKRQKDQARYRKMTTCWFARRCGLPSSAAAVFSKLKSGSFQDPEVNGLSLLKLKILLFTRRFLVVTVLIGQNTAKKEKKRKKSPISFFGCREKNAWEGEIFAIFAQSNSFHTFLCKSALERIY